MSGGNLPTLLAGSALPAIYWLKHDAYELKNFEVSGKSSAGTSNEYLPTVQFSPHSYAVQCISHPRVL